MQAKLLNWVCRRYKYYVCKERDQKKLISSVSIPLLEKVNAKEKVSESNEYSRLSHGRLGFDSPTGSQAAVCANGTGPTEL